MSVVSGFNDVTLRALNLRNHLCVLPFGEMPALEQVHWTESELSPYVHFIQDGKITDRMFGGFVLNCISARSGRYLCPAYAGFGDAPDKSDWLQYLDDFFAEGSIWNVLRNQADHPLDIWISVPYPHPSHYDFGKLGEKVIDFRQQTCRIDAVAWWIDQFAERLNHENVNQTNLQVKGLYWPKTSVDAADEPLVRQTTKFAESRGFCSLWLPHYGSYGVMKAESLGFHAVAVHPNYYGNAGYGTDWLAHSALFAKQCRTGFQIIFGNGSLYSDTHFLDYLNFGLCKRHGYMNDSLLVFQFPGQTLQQIRQTREADYRRLYDFIKGTYVKTSYPGITY